MGFGFAHVKSEGKALHPDTFSNFDSAGDALYLKQLKLYASWRGVEETKQEFCSRPHLLDKLKNESI